MISFKVVTDLKPRTALVGDSYYLTLKEVVVDMNKIRGCSCDAAVAFKERETRDPGSIPVGI